jgi:putative phage-type endonuclease
MLNMQDKFSSDLVQGSDLWLERRKRSVTASDISILMGSNPWVTPFQLFEQKLGYRTVEETEPMREGTRLEPFARQKLQGLFGVALNPLVCFHADFSWQMASLDAIDEKWQFLTEIKCSKKYHEQARDGTFAPHVNSQMQWQMHVTGVDHMYLYCFDGASGILIPVVRDDSYINQAIEKAKEFYQCLQSLEPPALSQKDIVQRADPEWCVAVREFREARVKLGMWEFLEKKAKEKLIKLAGESCAEGGGVKVTRYFRRGGIDYKEIIEKNCPGIDVEYYRKKGDVSWRIT